jgi:hypothetical protein
LDGFYGGYLKTTMRLIKNLYLIKAKFQHLYVTRDFYYNKLADDYTYGQKLLISTGFVDGYIKALEHMGIDPKDYPYGTEQCLLKSTKDDLPHLPVQQESADPQ